MLRSHRGNKRVEVRIELMKSSNRPHFASRRYLDHWAHLGGAAFGVAYYYGGMKIWNALRNATS